MNAPRSKGGFGYWVSDEQSEAYAKLTPFEGLQWLDEARRLSSSLAAMRLASATTDCVKG